MPKREPLPTQFVGIPFAAADARDCGISASRLRASDLRVPIRGVREPRTAENSFELQIGRYAAHMAEDEYFSHVTAAKLYGIPLPRHLENMPIVHVSVHEPAFPPRVRGIAGHRLSVPIAPRTRNGFRMVSPARTFTQLAAVLSHDDLVIAGDFLVKRKAPLCTLEELAAAVNSMGPARGARSARLALPEVRQGTDSPMETRTRLMIVRAQLPEPVIGHTVRDENGDFIGTPDLAYVRERIAIEYQGSDHWTNPAVFADDIERRILFERAGWVVILVIAKHIFSNPHWTAERIREALRDRANLPPLP
ncbi:hypothetical protein [Frigoribacterium sp. CG_9.8]|uniref:hypothetical protein n=1 Tax=Frigoribacterium sp. CG_9.8 TaxID=2787733 RepID=UPI0018CBBFF1|nr:hypothetical protein [Frigoribacterium sp. CG_9.8]MBG6108287.1 hypothetical protein [Frigoribacterium sp. CG_9.8]